MKSVAVAGYFKGTWRSTGLMVVLCCGGDARSDAKEALCNCWSKISEESIGAYEKQGEACKLQREITTGTFSEEEMTTRKKGIEDLEGKSSRLLAQSDARWPPDFDKSLNAELDDTSANIPNEMRDYIGLVIKAKWEANYAIMGRFVKLKTVGAIVNNSDLSTRLGDKFVSVKKFTMGGGQ